VPALQTVLRDPDLKCRCIGSNPTSNSGSGRVSSVLNGDQAAYASATLPFDKSARNDLISDETKSTKALTRGVCCMSRCMSR
jgi:hypothetical protein